MKIYGVIALLVILIGSWFLYSRTGSEMALIDQKIAEYEEIGDPDGMVPKLESEKQGLEGQKTFNGILLAFLSAGIVGILFVIFVLPAIAHRVTHAVYDSGEEVENDPLHEARSLIAQGEYEGAIEALKVAAAADPTNRYPWVEIAKLQKNHLENTPAAIQTIRDAVQSQDWEIDDAAFLMFRLSELYHESGDENSAAVTLRQVIEQFPETRHSANARHKLNEWGLA